jgi:NAD(P)-dependent dehydrogenase (short-subunit alcohol dehydrogenase family)
MSEIHSRLFDVTGRVAVVTGGASGLGLGMGTVLARAGAVVTLADVNGAELDRVVKQLKAEQLDVHGVLLDVSDWAAVESTLANIKTTHDLLDIVIANAGISGGGGPLTEEGMLANLDADVWRRVLDINLSGVAGTLRAAARHLTPGDSARIVVTSSVVALRFLPMVAYPYAASKSAVSTLVKYAAKDLAKSGIRINAIAPSGFDTNIGGRPLRDIPEVAQAFAEDSAFGRLAQSNELDGLTLLLCSDASSFISGATYSIDGGAV